jgi:hypothetical protein
MESIAPLLRQANRKPALLVFAVFQVGNSKESRIIENTGRKLEGHAVLLQV